MDGASVIDNADLNTILRRIKRVASTTRSTALLYFAADGSWHVGHLQTKDASRRHRLESMGLFVGGYDEQVDRGRLKQDLEQHEIDLRERAEP